MIDFEAVARDLLPHAAELCAQWLPGGSVKRGEYQTSGLQGGGGESLKINLTTGLWADFAAEDCKGGDLLSLYAAIHGQTQLEAARTLLGQPNGNGSGPKSPTEAPRKPREVRVICHPPADAPFPNLRHREYGAASQSWTYRDQAGALICIVARYDPPDGKKQIVTFSWSATHSAWRMWAQPDPRPLYGLDRLDGRHVLLVEGEKAADAAHAFGSKLYAVLSWHGGAQAVRKADWTPLYGRKVLLWPDADEPGAEAMQVVGDLLRDHCEEVKVLKVDGQPDGWDAADSGFTNTTEFLTWARPRAVLSKPVPKPAPEPRPAAAPPVLAVVQPNGSTAAVAKPKRDTTPQDKATPNLDNVLSIIENKYPDVVRYDVFHQKLFKADGTAFTNADRLRLMRRIQAEWQHIGMDKVNLSSVEQAIELHADNNQCNEVTAWMDTLKWDGTPRLRNFFATYLGAADSEYSRALGPNFWISMVARSYDPGCQMQFMVVLQGTQGIGKSTAMRIIGGDWYTETGISPADKDFYVAFAGKLIIDCGDLAAFSKTEITKIKNSITTATDRFRKPYGSISEDFPRRCVITGSTNEHQFLTDPTGGRRFMPILCTTPDVPALARDREQLFAEAIMRYRAGEKWHIMPVDATKAEQENRYMVDPWETIIAEYLIGESRVTTAQVLRADNCLRIPPGQQTKLDVQRASACLRRLGWESKAFKIKGNAVRQWYLAAAGSSADPEQGSIPL